MTPELDEFLTTTWDVQNLQYSLSFINSNEADLKKIYSQKQSANPNDPLYSRSFDEFKYGIVESFLTARIVMMATAIFYYIDPTDTKNIGFGGIAREFKKVCPEYVLKIDPNHKDLHTMDILMDLRNKSAHKKTVQDYKSILLNERPIEIMERNVIVKTTGQNDDVFIHGRNETKPQFMKKVTNITQKNMAYTVVPGVNGGTHSMTFGELLMDDAINCVRDYDARRNNPSSPSTRHKMTFY